MDTRATRQPVPVSRPHRDMTDAEAVSRAQRGDQKAAEFLLYRYRSLVKSAVQSFYIPGAEREDLLQIGMIGLWQAVTEYRADRSHSFRAFANLCVRRHILSAIKSAARLKQRPLNSSLPLETVSPTAWPIMAFVGPYDSPCCDPETRLISQECLLSLESSLRTLLSSFEWRVLTGFQRGMSYNEIASWLGCKVKSVDNALARIRRKVWARRHVLGAHWLAVARSDNLQ